MQPFTLHFPSIMQMPTLRYPLTWAGRAVEHLGASDARRLPACAWLCDRKVLVQYALPTSGRLRRLRAAEQRLRGSNGCRHLPRDRLDAWYCLLSCRCEIHSLDRKAAGIHQRFARVNEID